MDAKSFIAKHGKEAAQRVAERAGTKFVYLTQIASGHRKPSHKLAKALVDASNDEMTLTELRPDIFGAQQ